MSTPTADEAPEETPAPVPPPGCPAHAAAADKDGVVRLTSPEHPADPMALFERLRAQYGAVAPVLVEGDLPSWLILGYRENLEALRTPSRFTKDSRNWGSFQRGEVAPDSPLLPMVGWQPLVAFLEGEEHERLRAAVTDSIDRLDRRGVRRHVTRFANQLIDEFAAAGEADLVKQFAEQLPMLVMTQLFGIPDEYGPRLVDAVLALVAGGETAFKSNEYVLDTLQQYVPVKRKKPGYDIPSWLMEHPSDLSDEEVVQHLRVLIAAANQGTTLCISNTLRMVLTDHRFRASLAGARMTVPEAVEQVLWDEPPTMVCPARWAVGDTELGDMPIKAGDMLLLGMAAGNTDPEVRPDLAEPMHGNRSHLAFGGGPHECPGQDIGRAITETAVDVLLARLPDVYLGVEDKELVYISSWMSRHLTALPVRFTPKPPAPKAAETPTPAKGKASASADQAAPASASAASAVAEAPAPAPAAPAAEAAETTETTETAVTAAPESGSEAAPAAAAPAPRRSWLRRMADRLRRR